MNKRIKRVNPTQRYIKQLVNELGNDYLKKIEELRWELKLIMEEKNYAVFKISIGSGLYIDTIDDFLNGRNNISLKTYKLLKHFINKKKSKDLSGV